MKKGQIAHLDGNPSNNALDNLAWLCLYHHDEYDSRTSQSKGLTKEEVKKYRHSLHEEVRKTKKILLREEVVRDEYDKRFYIDNEGKRHLIPDDETARFLRSPQGEIKVSTEALEAYSISDPMDSVLSCDILYLEPGPHIFVVLNGKWYHVGIGDLADWGRHHPEDWQHVDEQEFGRYPRGR